MQDDSIRHHIEAARARPDRETRRLTSRIMGLCWPGGSDDRSEPAALDWIRRWRPATAGAPLAACSCARGNCLVCN